MDTRGDVGVSDRNSSAVADVAPVAVAEVVLAAVAASPTFPAADEGTVQ